MSCKRKDYNCINCNLNSDDCYLDSHKYFGYDAITFNLAYDILKKETDDAGYKTIVSKRFFHDYSAFQRLYSNAKALLRTEKIKSFL